MTKPDARTLFESLKNPPDGADANWFRARGRSLEKIIFAALDAEGLRPKINLRLDGEEIDGSFILHAQVFLLEAKWHADPIEEKDLLVLKGKVDGKLTGTLGIFLSMSGYTENAIPAFVKGKTINTILFDGADIETALAVDGGFTILLSEKLRAAAEEGTVFYPSSKVVGAGIPPEPLKISVSDGIVVEETRQPLLTFVCEGRLDQMIIQEVLIKLISAYQSRGRVRIIPAGGAFNLAAVANVESKRSNSKVFIIADTDGRWTKKQRLIEKKLLSKEITLVPVDPNLEEAWLGVKRINLAGTAANSLGPSAIFIGVSREVAKLDLEDLTRQNSSFALIRKEVERLPSY